MLIVVKNSSKYAMLNLCKKCKNIEIPMIAIILDIS